ncbi:hypothetical protein PTKIN_Ptkin14bG0079800 [Pterospermum kingtungense]
MEFVSPAARRIDPQAIPNGIDLLQQIVADLESEMDQRRKQLPDLRTCHSIYLFPSFLSGIQEGVRQPKLASFGPYYKGNDHLLPFEEHKTNFLYKFLERIEKSSRPNLVQQLLLQESSMRDCYYEDTRSISSEEFVKMLLTDGSFIVELFYQSANDLDTTWPWFNDLNTLIADLLKMGNQLPFLVLENLFHASCKTCDQATSWQALSTLALKIFNQALGRPLNMVFQNKQKPKHLLDLFRSSLLPATPLKINCKDFPESIQCAELLCNAGITLKRKKANSLLEIDFRKLNMPPFSLKIPPVAIDDLTSTILVHCVALEQCLRSTSKHFTAYIRFMNCLVRQPEDVRFLRTANIITAIQPDDHEYVINLFDSVRENVHFNARDCYLWKQYREIDSYYDSFGAYIWCNLAGYNALTLVVSTLAATIALGSWLFTWLLPKK